ncbi:MAG: hypothetical protein M1825_006025 [Sarcosagium campestre]|nr:MAG: hypothetical protein M1825_006025 [Sarcosagium campestre]
MTSTPQHTPERAFRRPLQYFDSAIQKQCIIDNLRQEITSRARRLRAQLALLAQSHRARLELRINRIPRAIRRETLRDLQKRLAEEEIEAKAKEEAKAKAEYEAAERAVNLAAEAVRAHAEEDARLALEALEAKKVTTTQQSKTRGIKRPSVDISDGDEFGNLQPPELSIPKKRVKTGTATASQRGTAAAKATTAKAATGNATTTTAPKTTRGRGASRQKATTTATTAKKTAAARAADAKTAPAKPTQRAASRKKAADPSQVLSPQSHNVRRGRSRKAI